MVLLGGGTVNDLQGLLIVVKRSKWERDLMRFGSEEEVNNLYEIQNHASARIYSSHLRQKENLRKLKDALKGACFVNREELTGLNTEKYSQIISLGGDNHFVYVSHFAGGKPIIGINSDPDTSHGALLYFKADDFIEKIKSPLSKNIFVIEEWSRIGCSLEYPGGRTDTTVPCTSEISLRSEFAEHISRYQIRKNDEPWEEQKSSGLLLACGAGSTGWFRNCHPTYLRNKTVFSKDADFFRIVAREYGHGAEGLRYRHAAIESSDTLEVISEMDGEINIDCHPERTYNFGPGCRAKFFLSKNPLRVVRDIKNA